MREIRTLDQDRTFYFYLITSTSISLYNFDWDSPNHQLHMRMLNMICGWPFVRDWNDKEYKFPTGKAVRMDTQIKDEANTLRKGFLAGENNNHKSLISSFCETLAKVEDGELFFIYRVVYTPPTQTLLYKIMNELSFIKQGKHKDEADSWFEKYASNLFNDYNVRFYNHAKVGELDKRKRVCRFCGKSIPAVQFNNVAHAIPESIGGHKNLICYEECDRCNESFGKDVERNLCEWFDFRRSSFHVKKKSGGVPKAYGRNYVIENNTVNIFINKTESPEIKMVGSGSVTLQGIYRALCKIAIDLIDHQYLDRLKTTIEWVRFGRPKSSSYPQIAQMYGLHTIESPTMFICSRKDQCDTDNAPMHFCILRIFDMAFLYVLPHINGRMVFHESYSKNIPTEALKLLDLSGEWVWDSYNTTEERNPHVLIDLSNSKIGSADNKRTAPIEKLRLEQKPLNPVDFTEPQIVETDIIRLILESIHFTDAENLNSVSGNICVQATVDLSQKTPLFIRLNIVYKDVRHDKELAVIVYSAQVRSSVLNHQMKVHDDESLCLNQNLFVPILEIMLKKLYDETLVRHTDFPYTRSMLYANNVRELLNEMQLILIKKGLPFAQIEGKDLWHTGY